MIEGGKMKIAQFAIVGLLILLLVNAGCSKEGTFDIRGQWSFRSGSEEIYVFAFDGWPGEGGLVAVGSPGAGSGTYTVSGKNVAFDFHAEWAGGKNCEFSGTFDSEDRMSGTMDFTAPYPPFEWTKQVEGLRQ
jgi:hypothetical protein